VQKIDGGYVLVSQKALLCLKAQISSRVLSANEARGICGLLEMRSIRKAAEALRGKDKWGRVLIPNYSAKELSKLTNLPFRVASKVLKIASSSDFFSSEKGKLVPVPRRIIRFLAKCEKRSTILVLLTYLERGMSLDKGKIKNAGTAKASLIASQTGLSLRSVRTVRAELLDLGIITPDTTKYQKKLNRDGAYFTINLCWIHRKPEVINRKGSAGTIKSPIAEKTVLSAYYVKPSQVVNNLRLEARIIAPLLVKNSPQIAPPYRDKITSKELRNQKTQDYSSNLTGVYTTNFNKVKKDIPKIWDVKKEDLKSFGRTENLYFQAIK
jgi:hypothetical protein